MSNVHKTFIEKLGAYENDEMSQDETIEFFQMLVDTGAAWKLQGHYGRVAEALIESGMVQRPEEEKQMMFGFTKPVVVTGETELFCNEVKKDLTLDNK